jgi:glycosyltransferase involved in cell wall biosynthesis
MRVLVDLRPAFDGHSGIPQETRLLFRGLAGLPGVQPVGLLQSGNLVLERGLPVGRVVHAAPAVLADGDVERLSGAVVSMLQGPAANRLTRLRRRWLEYAGPLKAALAGAAGVHTELTAFDPAHFRDFVWRSLFAKSLPAEDLEAVLRQEYRLLRWPWSRIHAVGALTAMLGRAVYPRLDTRGMDCFIAETPYPGHVRQGTKLIVRYHDAMPVLLPHTVKNRGHHRAIHLHALRRNERDGAWFACVSEATRSDLLAVCPRVESRAVVIPNMVSRHFHGAPVTVARVPSILRGFAHAGQGHTPQCGSPQPGTKAVPPYLLMVSTLEPRKNHLALLEAWEALHVERFPGLQLVFVGSYGWDDEPILRRIRSWTSSGAVHLLQGLPAEDLRVLYQHARVTVCPSFAEGFDFSGVEAMASGGIVASSDIPVHREIYGQASVYFNAYSVPDLTRVLTQLLDESEPAQLRRRALAETGRMLAARFAVERVMPQWQTLLSRVCDEN